MEIRLWKLRVNFFVQVVCYAIFYGTVFGGWPVSENVVVSVLLLIVFSCLRGFSVMLKPWPDEDIFASDPIPVRLVVEVGGVLVPTLLEFESQEELNAWVDSHSGAMDAVLADPIRGEN